jgi:hypothetical protein
MRDFNQAKVALGSIASCPALAGRWPTSAMPLKRTRLEALAFVAMGHKRL